MIRSAQMVSSVLADTEDTWGRIFAQSGRRYEDPVLVLFERAVQSACGTASAAVGPFYCPGDHKVYLDLAFFRELDQRFGAPGDFAQAYVVAHEVGHHVQTLLGLSNRVNQMRPRMSRGAGQRALGAAGAAGRLLRRRLGHTTPHDRDFLEQGDAEEGLRAAAAIGDDRLQKQGQGYVVPESFTHGTSAQRQEWLMRGLKTGDINQCDTFGGSN